MIRLVRGDDELIVSAEHGGAIAGWTRGAIHVLRRPSPEAMILGDTGAMGLFPLVPYCNRIASRRFSWEGRDYELAPNFGDHPHAIHGVGWQRPWDVEAISKDTVTLSLLHDVSGPSALAWPFPFRASLTYRLTGEGLSIELAATNRHSASAPLGIGVHPYFPRPAGSTIAFEADGVWFNRDSLPATHGAIPEKWNHRQGRPVDSEQLDNCFTGWRRSASLPGLRIEADAMFGNLQVFTPGGADFFCVEPVSHVPDAVNRPDLSVPQSMAVLNPGQEFRGSVTFAHASDAQVPDRRP